MRMTVEVEGVQLVEELTVLIWETGIVVVEYEVTVVVEEAERASFWLVVKLKRLVVMS
jgi:hypothetical protein